MPVFEKDVLYPGRYRLADGRTVEYSRDDVAHLKQRLKDMAAAGIQVPVAWEHVDEAKPQTAEQRASNRAKWNLGFTLDADETTDGFLVAKVDVPGEEDAKRLPSVRFASPEIVENFTDGTGKVWPGKSITHIAVTPRPVQHNQQPFKSVQLSGGVVRLSLTDRVGGDDQSVRQSLGERLSEAHAVPEKNKTKEADVGEGKDQADAKFQECLECLRADNYGLPDDTTPENLIERLHTAALTKRKMMGDQYGTGGQSTPSGEGVSPVTMSMEQRLVATEKRLLQREKEQLVLRIGNLFSTGRVSKPLRDKLLQEASTVQLSLDESGELKDIKLLAKVEAYEALPASFSTPERLSNGQGDDMTAVDAPDGMAGAPRTREEVDRAVDEFLELVGRDSKG